MNWKNEGMLDRFGIIFRLMILSNEMICILCCSFIGCLGLRSIFVILQVACWVLIFLWICWKWVFSSFILVHFVDLISKRVIRVISNFLAGEYYILMIFPIFLSYIICWIVHIEIRVLLFSIIFSKDLHLALVILSYSPKISILYMSAPLQHAFFYIRTIKVVLEVLYNHIWSFRSFFTFRGVYYTRFRILCICLRVL